MPLNSRRRVRDIITGITSHDAAEVAHQQWAIDWIDSGAPLWRTTGPATPRTHLAVYAAVLDPAKRALLLVDHRRARLWLPPGGHVEPGEYPQVAVARELHEELGLPGIFDSRFGPGPLFLTVTRTRPPHVHTDVTLWYVMLADARTPITARSQEIAGTSWFGLDAPFTGRVEPHLRRFTDKLAAALLR